MKKSITFSILVLSVLIMSGQTTDLTFTAINNEAYIQLDSIKIINRTQTCDTVLFWPDTVLSLNFVGINEMPLFNNTLQIFQNYPNPVIDKTTVSMYLPENGIVCIALTDVTGRMILETEYVLARGLHTFLLTPGRENLTFLTVHWQGHHRSIKILQAGLRSEGMPVLKYIGTEEYHQPEKVKNDALGFLFSPGDELIYVCYHGTMESGIHDIPEYSQSYIFQFATNIPCPGMATVEYGGQVYNTIQICSQCWFKENLNIGKMINAPNPQTNNDTIEKYCMGDMSYFCDLWGGLYFWPEMINYTAQSGTKGICPEGWHIPDELDWQILEGVADSEYGIGDPIWDGSDWRGTDAGGNLKQTGNENWEPPNTGATDAYGFTALPGGYYVQNDFWGHNYKGLFWSSRTGGKFLRNLDWNEARSRSASGPSGFAASVRCIKD